MKSSVDSCPVMTPSTFIRRTVSVSFFSQRSCAVDHAFSLWFWIRLGSVSAATIPITARVINISARVKAMRLPSPRGRAEFLSELANLEIRVGVGSLDQHNRLAPYFFSDHQECKSGLVHPPPRICKLTVFANKFFSSPLERSCTLFCVDFTIIYSPCFVCVF